MSIEPDDEIIDVFPAIDRSRLVAVILIVAGLVMSVIFTVLYVSYSNGLQNRRQCLLLSDVYRAEARSHDRPNQAVAHDTLTLYRLYGCP